MKLALGHPRWLEFRFDFAALRHALKARLTSAPRAPQAAQDAQVTSPEPPPHRRKRVFFDMP
jgi:hypothetical protein